MPKVSVLLTSYNHADYLRKSIDSILNQTYKDFELIIIDDCSTDNSWEIIKRYKDKKIKKIRNKVNKGSILSKELVESFEGEYFAIAHCDDCWEKTKLEKQVEYMEIHKEIAACFSHVKLIDEDDNEISEEIYTDFNIENRNRFEWLNYFFYHGNCLCHPSILIRKSVQLNYNLFAFGLCSFPDFYRWIKLCLNHEIYIYPEKLTYFRIRKGGLNTSGYNYTNIIRGTFEEYQLLDLYLNLSDKDLQKTFPELSNYVIHNYFNKKYAFARHCIKQSKKNYIFYGLNLIYKLLQDDIERANLEKYYHYTKRDYITETGKIDFFSTVDLKKIMNSTLFFDIGNDYNEVDAIRVKILKRENGHFEIMFNLNGKRVKGLRFDPDEGRYCCCSNLKILIDGEPYYFYANCSYQMENKYYFHHTDPSLLINIDKIVERVYVEGVYEELDIDKVCDYKVNAIVHDKRLKNKLKRFINNLRC